MEFKETMDFYEINKEEIDVEIEEEWDIYFLSQLLYHNDNNWNNGDHTNGQYIYTKDEIEIMLQDIFDFLCKQEGRCSHCGRLLENQEQLIEINSVPQGDSFITERLVKGYECKCGETTWY